MSQTHLPVQSVATVQYTELSPLAVQSFNQDVMGDMGKGWNNLVSTGQIWALMIGVVLGYLLKSVTSSH